MTGRLATLLIATLLALPAGSARADVFEFAADGGFARVDRTDAAVPGSRAAPVSADQLDVLTGPARARTILAAITTLAQRHRLNPALVEAVAWEESRLHPGALSPKGAIGVMQLMPVTAARMGINPYDWHTNVSGGVMLLASLMRRYDNDLIKTLAAYNAGTAAVDRYRGVPPWKETRAYVAAILERLANRAVQNTASSEG
ncbi:lytic transglycosylase domain-containing protein [Novosphingobium sp.]|uniref:lytic transglycosylase domain-containing protein n=1 Tax=Novosphingobium sp. TaxID=1874826 RepID=UPI00333FF11E